MDFAAITQSLKNRFEGYIPLVSSTEANVLTGATLAYQLYQKSLVGTLLAGVACAATACLRLRERVTLATAVDRLHELDGDLRTSIRKGNFSAKKTLFISRCSSLLKVFASNPYQNHYTELTWQEAIEKLSEVHQRIQLEANPLVKMISTQGVKEHIFSFLGTQEVCQAAKVSRLWRQSVHSESHWKIRCNTLIPGVQPQGNTYWKLAKEFYPKTFGRAFYQNYYGIDLGPIPSIPPQLLEKADALIFVPEYFSLTIPANSPLDLDQNGRLIENPDKYHNRPPKEKRTLQQVPVTLNNLDLLTRKYLKKGFSTGIYSDSWSNVLPQRGNEHFPAHWSGQKRAVIGKGLSFAQQQAAARVEGLEVVSLLDRVLFNFVMHVRSGQLVDKERENVRTATIVLENANLQQAAICIRIDPLPLLLTFRDIDAGYVGVAVGVSS